MRKAEDVAREMLGEHADIIAVRGMAIAITAARNEALDAAAQSCVDAARQGMCDELQAYALRQQARAIRAMKEPT